MIPIQSQVYPTLGLGLRRIGSGSLWDSGRRIFLSSPPGALRARMGQFDPNNRLLSLPVKTILSRWILALKPDYWTLDMFKERLQRAGYEGILSPPNLGGSWTEDNVKLLVEIQKDPTTQEIKDLSMIDGFFLPPTSDMLVDKDIHSWEYPSHGTGMMKDAFCSPPPGVQRDESRPVYFRRLISNFDPGQQSRGRQWNAGPPESPIPGSEKDPFYCPPTTVHYSRNLPAGTNAAKGYFGSLPANFQINPDDTWGGLKSKVENALATLDQQSAQAASAPPSPAGTDQSQKGQAKTAAEAGSKPTSTGTYIAAGGIAAGVIAAVVALVR